MQFLLYHVYSSEIFRIYLKRDKASYKIEVLNFGIPMWPQFDNFDNFSFFTVFESF